MRIRVSILLFQFIAFLSVPTIVTLFEKDLDMSSFYSSSEEEIHKQVPDYKVTFKFFHAIDQVLHVTSSAGKIFSENQSDVDLLSREIVIPPPKVF